MLFAQVVPDPRACQDNLQFKSDTKSHCLDNEKCPSPVENGGLDCPKSKVGYDFFSNLSEQKIANVCLKKM